MRLIDAEALKEHVKKYMSVFAKYDWREICEMLNDAPTVDPVKHGHWTSSQGLAEVGEVQCSNCKTIYYAEDLYNVGETDENGIGQALMPNYCPHCGAKMDEVEDETN